MLFDLLWVVVGGRGLRAPREIIMTFWGFSRSALAAGSE
jgi:hypothetical protein